MHTFLDPNPKKRKKRKPLGKTQAPHRITQKQLKELYKMIAYNPLNPRKTESKPVTNDDSPEGAQRPNDIPVVVKDVAIKPKVVKDLPGIA